jgi:hypothetical protein
MYNATCRIHAIWSEPENIAASKEKDESRHSYLCISITPTIRNHGSWVCASSVHILSRCTNDNYLSWDLNFCSFNWRQIDSRTPKPCLVPLSNMCLTLANNAIHVSFKCAPWVRQFVTLADAAWMNYFSSTPFSAKSMNKIKRYIHSYHLAPIVSPSTQSHGRRKIHGVLEMYCLPSRYEN